MADNVTLNSSSGGDTIAADDISSVKHQRVKIQYGADGSATDVSPATPLMVHEADIALGTVTGRKTIRRIGERDSMEIKTTGEDVTRMNELSPSPTSDILVPTPADAGEQMVIVSEDANDTNTAGTGARKVTVHWLDETGAEGSEVVNLNGTTGVNLAETNVRFINDMYISDVGSGGVAAGHIKIYKSGSVGLVYDMIAAGGNKSLVPHFMVPLAKKLILKGWSCSESQGTRTAFRLRSSDMHGTLLPGIFCFKDSQYLNKTASGWIPINVDIPALSIIKVTGWSTAAGAEGACSWWGELVDD